MRYIESTTIAVMVLCGVMAVLGCTGMAIIGSFLSAAIVRAWIAARDFMCDDGKLQNRRDDGHYSADAS